MRIATYRNYDYKTGKQLHYLPLAISASKNIGYSDAMKECMAAGWRSDGNHLIHKHGRMQTSTALGQRARTMQERMMLQKLGYRWQPLCQIGKENKHTINNAPLGLLKLRGRIIAKILIDGDDYVVDVEDHNLYGNKPVYGVYVKKDE